MLTLSRLTYAETIETLKEAIAKTGNTISACIDQSAAAEGAGLTLPHDVDRFRNPRGGTPLMDAFPLVALDLPLKLLVWEESLGVNVAYVPMSDIAARYGVTGMDARIEAIARAVDSLISAVAVK